MYCEIVYQNTGERWGIFPKDIGEFQARIFNLDNINTGETQNTIIKKSAKIEIMSCSFSPDKKNMRHQKALDDLIGKLVKAGWVPLAEQGEEWYSRRFYKNDNV